MFPGKTIKLGDEEFVVPALSLGQLRNGVLDQLQEHDKLVAEGKTFEAMDIRGKVILVAMQRNYPDFSEEKLLTYLDLQNTTEVWLSVLGLSGFSLGENQAAQTEATPGISNPSIAA